MARAARRREDVRNHVLEVLPVDVGRRIVPSVFVAAVAVVDVDVELAVVVAVSVRDDGMFCDADLDGKARVKVRDELFRVESRLHGVRVMEVYDDAGGDGVGEAARRSSVVVRKHRKACVAGEQADCLAGVFGGGACGRIDHAAPIVWAAVGRVERGVQSVGGSRHAAGAVGTDAIASVAVDAVVERLAGQDPRRRIPVVVHDLRERRSGASAHAIERRVVVVAALAASVALVPARRHKRRHTHVVGGAVQRASIGLRRQRCHRRADCRRDKRGLPDCAEAY